MFHITRTTNVSNIIEQGLVPTIGPLSRLAGQVTPCVFLFPSMDDAVHALMNWYGEEIDALAEEAGEAIELCIIEINASQVTTSQGAVAWECVSFETIPSTAFAQIYSEEAFTSASQVTSLACA